MNKGLGINEIGEPKRVVMKLSGATRPKIIEFMNGNQYVVKFKNNKKKPQYLIKEYLVGCLAKELYLPVVPFELIEIKEGFIDNNKELSNRNFYPGTQFCSKYIHSGISLALPFPEKFQIINEGDIVKLLVFDAWVGNKDRHTENILLEPVGEDRYKFHIIDHTHTLKKDKHRKVLRKKKNLYLWCFSYMRDTSELHRFGDTITSLPDQKIEEILESMPDDWDVSPNSKRFLFQYLQRSKEELQRKIDDMITFFNLQEIK